MTIFSLFYSDIIAVSEAVEVNPFRKCSERDIQTVFIHIKAFFLLNLYHFKEIL